MRKLLVIVAIIVVVLAYLKNNQDSGSGSRQPTAPGTPAGDPSASLQDQDGEFLKSFRAGFGFPCLVADQLYFRNPGYEFALRDFHFLDIRNPQTSRVITVDFADRKTTYGDKTPAQVAEDIWTRMQKELGAPPAPPANAHPLLEPLMMGHGQAQKILYPDKYGAETMSDMDEELAEAQRTLQSGNREDGIRESLSAVSRRFGEFGQNDPRTLRAIAIYFKASGKYVLFESQKDGHIVWDLTREEVLAKSLTPNPDGTVSGAAPTQSSQP